MTGVQTCALPIFEALAADGAEYRKLFTDEAEQKEFLAWKRESSKQAPEKNGEPEELPEFESDADMIRYIEDRAVQRLKAEQEASAKAEREQANGAVEAHQKLIERGEAMYERFPDTSEEDYVEACNALGQELKDQGINPVEHLRTDERLFSGIQKHLEVVTLRKRLADLEGKSRADNRKATRSIQASSPAGTSVPAPEPDLSTREGRLEATLRDAPGDWLGISGAPIKKS